MEYYSLLATILISVIIPLYNKQAFVSESIQSVLNQTFPNFELIVVDDGSTDESLSIVRELSDPRIQIISIPNSGVSFARNAGINNAQYDWIAFLDADDWWAPTFLAEVVAAMEHFSNQLIFATGRTRLFERKSERYSNEFLPKHDQLGVVNYFQIIAKDTPPINSSNCVISKGILSQVQGFTHGMKRHEDHDLWIKLCAKNKVLFINKPLSFYRKDTVESASQKPLLYADFFGYLRTMREVKNQLSDKDKVYFSNYFNQFIIISYFQNYYRYHQSERKAIFNLVKEFAAYRTLIVLRCLNLFSFCNIYQVYKALKGNEN